MRARLTLLTAKSLGFNDLVELCESTLADYDPADDENQLVWRARVGRTIEEMPAIYRWFLSLRAHFDNWTDGIGDQLGTRNIAYKEMRQRRDLMEDFAKAAKMRYEAASRVITLEAEFDGGHMPESRRSPTGNA
jgi:hypothetical protein